MREEVVYVLGVATPSHFQTRLVFVFVFVLFLFLFCFCFCFCFVFVFVFVLFLFFCFYYETYALASEYETVTECSTMSAASPPEPWVQPSVSTKRPFRNLVTGASSPSSRSVGFFSR
jgi:hypothetical protein